MAERKQGVCNVPKLRFPEFRGAGEWETKQLEQILTSISNGLNLDQVNDITGHRVTRIETISSQKIDLEKIGYIKTEQDISSYRLNVGDILFSNINSLAHIGKTVIIDRDYNLHHGINLLRLVVEKKSFVPKFVFYLLNIEPVKCSFRARANKAVNQASINQTELGKTIVALPLRDEQQKIAECLSSLDDLVALQSQKLDALKIHKKGLMQQLFPAEGGNQPKLRFPEFQGAGEWETKQLEQILTSISNGVNLDQVNDITGHRVTRIETISSQKIDLKKIGYIKTEQDISSYRLNVGDILFSNINSLAHIGKTVIIDRDYNLHHGINLLRLVVEKKSSVPKFVFYLLNIEPVKCSFRARANKAVNQASINQTELGKTIVALPLRSEQQKIADCLSSLDDLLALQSQKLDALKIHKKGLMQQLFPSPDEACRRPVTPASEESKEKES